MFEYSLKCVWNVYEYNLEPWKKKISIQDLIIAKRSTFLSPTCFGDHMCMLFSSSSELRLRTDMKWKDGRVNCSERRFLAWWRTLNALPIQSLCKIQAEHHKYRQCTAVQ